MIDIKIELYSSAYTSYTSFSVCNIAIAGQRVLKFLNDKIYKL